jgi:hypothetical protein
MAAQVAFGSIPDPGIPADSSDSSRMASATAMLAEFSRNGATTTIDHDDASSLEESHGDYASVADDEPYNNIPKPFVQRDLADTASLLRELSSLGFEDEPTPPPDSRPAPATPPRQVSAPPPSKKKRGLFGR